MFFKLFGAIIAIAAGAMLYIFPPHVSFAGRYGVAIVYSAIVALVLIYSAATARRKKIIRRRLINAASSHKEFFLFHKKEELFATKHFLRTPVENGYLLDEIRGAELFCKYEIFSVKFNLDFYVKIPTIGDFNVTVSVKNFEIVFANCNSRKAIEKLPNHYDSNQAARTEIERVLKKALEVSSNEALRSSGLDIDQIETVDQTIADEIKIETKRIFSNKADHFLAAEKELYFYSGEDFDLSVDFLPKLSRTDNKIMKK
jgi:hypothetical protein